MPPIIQQPLEGHGPHTVEMHWLIVHSMAEYVSNDDERWGPVGVFPAYEWLLALNLSVHALCYPDGTIAECVPSSQMAWHAKGFNNGTLGMEFIVPGEHDYTSFLRTIGAIGTMPADPYRLEQYDAGGWWFAQRAREYDLNYTLHVTSHHRLDPQRKRDPGPVFAWALFREAYESYAA